MHTMTADEGADEAVALLHAAAEVLAVDGESIERADWTQDERVVAGLEDDLQAVAQGFLLRPDCSAFASRERALVALLNDHTRLIEGLMVHIDLVESVQEGRDRIKPAALRKFAARRLRESTRIAEQARVRLSDHGHRADEERTA